MKDTLRILLAVMMFCFWSCSSEGEDIPEPTPKPESNKVEISGSVPVVEQKGSTATVTFTTNAAWTASVSSSTSWVTVSPTSGNAGTHTLTITTTENDTYDERNATVTIKAGNASKNITVTQKQKDALIVTSNKVEMGADDGNFTIEAKANVSLSYEIEESAKEWIVAGESRALTTNTLKFHAKANNKIERRQGNITLKGGDGLTETVTVYQEGEEVSLVLTTAKDMTIGSEGGTLKIELESNTEIKMEGLEADWLRQTSSRSMSAYTYYIEVDANETYDERNAAITFTSGDKQQIVTVTQKQKDALIVTSNKVEMGADGGNFTIEAKANVSLSYEIEESAKEWIVAGESRALTTNTLKFHAKANNKTERRQGNIILKGGDGLTETVTVYQEGENPALVITSDDVIVGSEGETIKIELKSNVDYTMVLPNVDWISQAESRAISAYTHYLTIAPNESYDQRSAMVYFNNEAEGLKDSISITQLQLDAIIVAQNEYEIACEGDQLEFKVSYNVDFNISISVDWIKQNAGSRGLTENALRFTIEENEAKESRSGEIIMTNGELKQTVRINQQGAPDFEAIERAALIDLYNAAQGDNWTNNTNWCSDKPVSEWYGVDTNHKGRVITLDLLNNGLVCKDVPESLTNLKELEYLNIRTTSTAFPNNILKLKNLYYIEWTLDGYTGPLPKEICNLQNLGHLGISGDFTSFPEELGNMQKLEYLGITGPWYGGSTILNGIPTSISNLINLKHLHFSYFDMPIEIPDWIYEMRSLEYLGLNNLGLTGTISEKISNLTNLKSLFLSDNKLEGNIPNGITSLANLESLLLFSNNLTGNIPIGFAPLTKLVQIWMYNNQLSGELPYDFEQNPNYTSWGVEQNVMIQQAGYRLTYPSNAYESTDYSKDGEVIILQEASKGSGVDIVLLGDGFVDTDMSQGGAYEKAMNEALGYLFALEPMKSYKEYFNVYAVKAVSKNNRFAEGYSTALDSYLDIAPYVSGNLDKCLAYASKAPVESTDDLTIAVILNGNVHAGTTFWLENNLGVSFIGMANPVDGIYEKTFESVFIHEVVGHAFGKLADEYVYYNETYPETGNMELSKEWKETGYYANVDIISDPTLIKWAHMLNDERFSSYTGIVEGGEYFAYGIWRPENESMMRNNQPYFNAPSREAIVKRIMKLAGEKFTFESFAQKDKYNPLPYARANVKTDFEPTPSPVIIKGSRHNSEGYIPKR